MGSTSKKPRAYYHIENRRRKSGDKHENMLKQYKTLQKRVTVEGETKWLKNALAVLKVRMDKAGLKASK